MRPPGAAAVANALLLLSAGLQPLCAQVVRGRLVDASADRPVASAFVQLLDARDVRVAGALTDSMGGFVLQARTAGEYRLRAERLGYESVMSPVLRLGSAPLDYVFELNPRALVLPSVDVRAENSRGCERRPDGKAVVALWNAVRTALTVTSWTGETGALRFSMLNHVRELDPSLRSVTREERTPSYSTAAIPYGAYDPAYLASDGYAIADEGKTWLLGMDADVLLSEPFLNTHCFRIVSSSDTTRVGLGFTPLRSDERTDVSGVLWVNRRTSELEHLEFEYEGLPDHMRRFGATGEVHFERLPTGAWIITRWWIRSPLVGARRGSRRYVLLGYREDGGTVTAAEAINTKLYGLQGRGTITGFVHDSVTNRPMVNALVFLSGTPFSAVSNGSGSYRIERVPDGSYAIGFTHSLLEELGVPQALDSVRVAGTDVIERSFAAPSMTGILRAVCPGEEEELTMGLLYGFVMSEAGEPLAGVEVRAAWKGRPLIGAGRTGRTGRTGDSIVDRWRTAETRSDGRYSLCWLPTDREIRLRVNAPEVPRRNVTIDLENRTILRRDF
jgi:hypothetical protein